MTDRRQPRRDRTRRAELAADLAEVRARIAAPARRPAGTRPR